MQGHPLPSQPSRDPTHFIPSLNPSDTSSPIPSSVPGLFHCRCEGRCLRSKPMSDQLCRGKALKSGRECADQRIDNTFKKLLEGRTAGHGVSMPWKPAMVSFLPGQLLSIQARARTLTREVMGGGHFQTPSRLCIENNCAWNTGFS